MSQEFPNLNTEGKAVEQHEQLRDITVFRVRHGDTEYKEQLKGEMEDDLTELGKKQLRESAENILKRIDVEKDVVWLISSPRVRAQDSRSIIEATLREAGVTLWDGARDTERGGTHSATFDRIRNFDFSTDGSEGEREIVPTGDDRYPDIFKKVISDLESEADGVAVSQKVFLTEHPQLEKSDDRIARTRNQLTYLMRIARQIQPKLDKHIVIIQTEHTESIDDLIENATRGKRTEKKATGIQKGGVVEVHFPTDPNKDEIEAIFLDSGEHFTIGYDPDKRSFSQPKG